MKKVYLFLVAVLGVMSLNAQSKVTQPVSTEYDRSSVSFVFVNRGSQNRDIQKFYQNFRVDAKFDDNKIPTKFIDVIHSSNQPVTAENVTAFVNSSKLGKEVMSFIFNRKSDGTFDDSIVRDRGMYNATDQDILNMRVAKVKEVAYEWGEPLVNSSYIVVYDIYQHQSEKDEKGNITYKVNVAAHAYKLNAGTEFINNFYKTAWADATSSEAEKEAARKGFDKMQIEFTHVASVSASGSSSTNSLWTGSFYEACQNAYESAVQALENRIPAWQAATSVISLNPIAAKIGTKEGLTNGSRYQAYSFREDAQGIRVIKALSKNEYENRRYEKVNKALCKDETKAGVIMGVVNPIMTMLMNLGIVAVVAVSAYFVAKQKSSPATVIAFMQYFTLISMAMMSLSRMFVMYTKCAASANRISDVMNSKSELDVKEDDGQGDESYHISFENVSFSYLGKKNNIENITFLLKKGERLGIIGATGSGKSTIVRLMMRFYDTDTGVIRIKGKDVRSYTPTELTSMFGVVLQNDFLYADTIEENICFGRDITHETVVHAAKIAQAHDFISDYSDGYEHMISAGGTNLSGGQRQRMLIARALAGNPEILILDDSSSALDYKTDLSLRSTLQKELPESTVITVAQRVSSVKNCNLILVIDEGKIIGSGTHEELLANCPEYKEISDSQMGGAFID